MTRFHVDPEVIDLLDGDAAAAVVYAAIQYKLNAPEAAYEHDGAVWWPATLEDICALTSLKLATVRRVVKVLVKAEFITADSKHGYDRTTSYRLGGDQVLKSTDGDGNPQMEVLKSPLPSAEIDRCPSYEEVKTFSPQAAPKGPLPDDWTPTPEHEALAVEYGWTAEERATLFRLHHSLRKTRHTRTEWDAAFELYLRSGPRNAPKPTVAPAPSHPNPRSCSHEWALLPGSDTHRHCRHCKVLESEAPRMVRG
jgi:hypothetical protein